MKGAAVSIKKYRTILFKLCRRFPVVTVLAVAIGKAQRQTPKRVGICANIFDPLHLTSSLLQLLKGIDSV
jgi:hypothetical protein